MHLSDQPKRAGKILDHGAGLGEANRHQVEVRARELAMIAGLSADEVTDAFRFQARQELRGAVDPNLPNDDDPVMDGLIERDDVPGQSGGAVAPETDSAASDDEQTVGAALYAEGMAEATHDQMVESRKREREDESL